MPLKTESEATSLKSEFAKERLRYLAEQISEQFGDAEFAGIVRAAVKLGFSDSKSYAPVDAYRDAVKERAIALLAPHLRRGSEQHVREAMQAAFGILTDAAICKSGDLRPGSARMTEAVVAVIVKLVSAGEKSAGKSDKKNQQEIPAPKKLEVEPERPHQKQKTRKVRSL